MSDVMTYEFLVEECRRLRAAAEAAEAAFFGFLRRAETEHEKIWKDAGCATFEQFLRSNTLCDTNRYALWVKGTQKIGSEAAAQHAVNTTVIIGAQRDPDPGQVIEILTRSANYQTINKTAPAEKTVKEWGKEIFDRKKSHVTTRKVDELTRLQAENQKLKAELKAAQARIVELETQLGAAPAAE